MITYVVGPSVDVVAAELYAAGARRIAWAWFVGPNGENFQILTKPLGPQRERLRFKRAASYESGEGAPDLDAWIKEMIHFENLVKDGQAEWV